MKQTTYTCDECADTIDERSGELCVLKYEGMMGHNKFISDKHYHYHCFCTVVRRIVKE